MKQLFIFLFGITLLMSCTKLGKNVTVKGRVLNPVTGQGIAGAEIWLQKSSGGYEGGYKTVKKAISDENGYYKIDKLGLASYRATCQTGDRYDLGWTTDNGETFTSNFWLDVKKGKTIHADYYTVPYGFLKINIENTSCFDSNDELKIYRTHSIPTLYDKVPNPAIYTGCINQQGISNKAPMGWYKYYGTVTKNNIVTTIIDSIYVDESESKIWNINY